MFEAHQGGLRGPNMGPWGSLRWLETTTKVWCWDGGSVQQNQAQPAAEFGAQWDPQEKMVKMQ